MDYKTDRKKKKECTYKKLELLTSIPIPTPVPVPMPTPTSI